MQSPDDDCDLNVTPEDSVRSVIELTSFYII